MKAEDSNPYNRRFVALKENNEALIQLAHFFFFWKLKV